MRADCDNVAFGLILVWIGVAMATDIDNEIAGLNFMAIGGILVLGWLVRRLRGSKDDGLGIVGIVLGFVGLNQYLNEQGRDLPVAALVVAAIGIVIVVTSIRPGKKPSADAHDSNAPVP